MKIIKKRERKEKQIKNKHSLNKRAVRKGSYHGALSAVVIAIVVVVNLIAAQLPLKYTEFDISTGKLYTIGEETKKLLNNMNESITIYYIVQSGNEDETIEKLLKQYEENSSKIKLEQIDPVTSPNYVSQFTTESVNENSLIVAGTKRNKVVDYSSMYETEFDYSTYQSQVTGFDGEGQITSAIAYVLSDEMPVVYCVTGHNEVSLTDTITDRIEKANIEIQDLNLLTAGEVPEDAACLLLNSPETDYSEAEAEAVISYLQKGGRAFLLTDYTGKNHENYDNILKEYGIEVTDGIIIETDSSMYVQRPYYIVPEIGVSDVTEDMTGGNVNVLLSGCQGFKADDNARDTLNITTVLSPSEDAYVKTQPQTMTEYDKEEGDEEGPFAVAYMVSEDVQEQESDGDGEDSDEQESVSTKLVCMASSSILDSSMNSMVSDGNYNLYMNVMNWLVDSGDSNQVSVASKSVAVDYITVTAGDAAAIALFVCIILPAGCLILGGIICHSRKKK